MYASLHDKALWGKVIGGDKDALAFIYRSYFSSLYKYGMKLHPDADLVQDCIHDLFVTIWLSRENLSLTDSIRFYLLASLKRRIVTQLKGSTVQLDEDLLGDTLPENSPEEKMIGEQSARDLRERLKGVMEKLPKRQQEILHLRFYEGLDPQQTADIMELNINSAYVLLSKALNFLKKHSDQLMGVILIALQGVHY